MRRALRPDEREALEVRYKAAIELARASGYGEVAVALGRVVAERSKAVIAMRLGDCERLVNSENELFKNYYWRVRTGERAPADAENDAKRRITDALLWGPAGEEIRTAALCLTATGLKSYGDVYLTLSERFFDYRSVVLEENSYHFVTRHAIKKPFAGPLGYLATWAERHMLAVAKHVSDLTTSASEASFSALILRSDVTREDDEFLEIAIYGGFNIKAVESITPDPRLTAAQERENDIERSQKLRWRVLYQQWERQKR